MQLHMQGENSHQAKIDGATVLLIRAHREKGWKYRDISAKFGLCVSQIWRIVNGQCWSHIK